MTQVYIIRFPNGKAYVGVSGQLARRLRDHCKANTLIGKALRKYAGQSTVEILFEGSQSDCFQLEARLVSELGTLSPQGYNQTLGGVGGRGLTAEARERKSASHKAWWGKSSNRKRLLAILNTPKHSKVLSLGALSMWSDPVKRQNHMTARARPEYKALRSVSMTEVQSRPEVIEKKRASANNQWSNPAMRAKMIAGMRSATKST